MLHWKSWCWKNCGTRVDLDRCDGRLYIYNPAWICWKVGGFLPGVKQIANVAALPGIVGHSVGLPDVHSGYGFAIGINSIFRLDDKNESVFRKHGCIWHGWSSSSCEPWRRWLWHQLRGERKTFFFLHILLLVGAAVENQLKGERRAACEGATGSVSLWPHSSESVVGLELVLIATAIWLWFYQ